jgi:hypothetical protein
MAKPSTDFQRTALEHDLRVMLGSFRDFASFFWRVFEFQNDTGEKWGDFAQRGREAQRPFYLLRPSLSSP